MVKKELKNKYFEGIGRRKTAVARVRIFESAKNQFEINSKTLEDFFPITRLQKIAISPLDKSKLTKKVTIHIKGGGIMAQAESIRLGLSRALIKSDLELKTLFRKLDFIKRDSRVKERKKFGLLKARKAPQWSKR